MSDSQLKVALTIALKRNEAYRDALLKIYRTASGPRPINLMARLQEIEQTVRRVVKIRVRRE